MEDSEYLTQAKKFLEKTGTELTVTFLKWDYHFDDDKEKRDIYEVTLKRGERNFTFKFGNSIVHSGEYILYPERERIHLQLNSAGKPNKNIKDFGLLNAGNSEKNKEFKAPDAYDILSCLTTYDPGTFDDFCADFGYDNDSIKANKTYKAVQNEYDNLKMLYSNTELEKLGEIQ